MAEKEGKPLLKENESPAYGGESSKSSDPPPVYEDVMRGGTSESSRPTDVEGGETGRLRQKIPLEKLPEGQEIPQSHRSSKFGCQNLSSMFGVKSYLHHFYETHSYKDPDMYEEEEAYRYLLHPPGRKRRRCTSIWWKVFVWIGANFLIFGVIGVLVGYLVPQRAVFEKDIGENIKVINTDAIPYNFNLDVCKLVGLILFCIGGLTLTVALLFPSFLYNYCGEEERKDGAFRVAADKHPMPPLSPQDQKVPAFSTVTNVQPNRKGQEAILTQEGMVEYKD